MAKKYFQNKDPLGERILIQQIVPGKPQLGPELPWEVVGVVADERVDNLNAKDPSAGVYVSNQQSPEYFQAVVVRTAMDPSALESALRHAVYQVDKDQPLTKDATTMHEQLDLYGVKNSFEIYPGTHTSGIVERFKTKILPYFAANLQMK